MRSLFSRDVYSLSILCLDLFAPLPVPTRMLCAYLDLFFFHMVWKAERLCLMQQRYNILLSNFHPIIILLSGKLKKEIFQSLKV